MTQDNLLYSALRRIINTNSMRTDLPIARLLTEIASIAEQALTHYDTIQGEEFKQFEEIYGDVLQASVAGDNARKIALKAMEMCTDHYRKVLAQINELCGTVNFSSHNQMREAIEGAVELSEQAIQSPKPSTIQQGKGEESEVGRVYEVLSMDDDGNQVLKETSWEELGVPDTNGKVKWTEHRQKAYPEVAALFARIRELEKEIADKSPQPTVTQQGKEAGEYGSLALENRKQKELANDLIHALQHIKRWSDDAGIKYHAEKAIKEYNESFSVRDPQALSQTSPPAPDKWPSEEKQDEGYEDWRDDEPDEISHRDVWKAAINWLKTQIQ